MDGSKPSAEALAQDVSRRLAQMTQRALADFLAANPTAALEDITLVEWKDYPLKRGVAYKGVVVRVAHPGGVNVG